MIFPEFICHDVLQKSRTTLVQKRITCRGDNLYDIFIRSMKPFEGYPVTLAVLGEGLVENSECLEYMKSHPEWTPQVHGFTHRRYDGVSTDKFYGDICTTRDLIIKRFGRRPTVYIPPYNKYDTTTRELALKAGLTQKERLRKPGHYKKEWHNCRQVDYHYWSAKNMGMAYFILHYFTVKPHYIIGAPRSGTTALMRFMGKDAVVLKEKESFWNNKTDLRKHYARLLADNGSRQIVDKNVRNSFRILDLQERFPEAKFTHIIRDGRAAISSWRDWAVKTRKKDTSIEGAAKQWVKYVNYILDNRHLLKDYSEVRYEELCFKYDYFISRNGKWKNRLTKPELEIVMNIAGGLLRRLGYA